MKIRTYQACVDDWMRRCFVRKDSMTPEHRAFRFIEEALELVQAMGTLKGEALQLVEYVYNRPPGDPPQEIGGVMVTLCGVASSLKIELTEAALAEFKRCEDNIEKIRAKDLAKPERAANEFNVAWQRFMAARQGDTISREMLIDFARAVVKELSHQQSMLRDARDKYEPSIEKLIRLHEGMVAVLGTLPHPATQA